MRSFPFPSSLLWAFTGRLELRVVLDTVTTPSDANGLMHLRERVAGKGNQRTRMCQDSQLLTVQEIRSVKDKPFYCQSPCSKLLRLPEMA